MSVQAGAAIEAVLKEAGHERLGFSKSGNAVA